MYNRLVYSRLELTVSTTSKVPSAALTHIQGVPEKVAQARVHPVHAMNGEQRQMAADLWTKPTDLSRRPPLGC